MVVIARFKTAAASGDQHHDHPDLLHSSLTAPWIFPLGVHEVSARKIHSANPGVHFPGGDLKLKLNVESGRTVLQCSQHVRVEDLILPAGDRLVLHHGSAAHGGTSTSATATPATDLRLQQIALREDELESLRENETAGRATTSSTSLWGNRNGNRQLPGEQDRLCLLPRRKSTDAKYRVLPNKSQMTSETRGRSDSDEKVFCVLSVERWRFRTWNGGSSSSKKAQDCVPSKGQASENASLNWLIERKIGGEVVAGAPKVVDGKFSAVRTSSPSAGPETRERDFVIVGQELKLTEQFLRLWLNPALTLVDENFVPALCGGGSSAATFFPHADPADFFPLRVSKEKSGFSKDLLAALQRGIRRTTCAACAAASNKTSFLKGLRFAFLNERTRERFLPFVTACGAVEYARTSTEATGARNTRQVEDIVVCSLVKQDYAVEQAIASRASKRSKADEERRGENESAPARRCVNSAIEVYGALLSLDSGNLLKMSADAYDRYWPRPAVEIIPAASTLAGASALLQGNRNVNDADAAGVGNENQGHGGDPQAKMTPANANEKGLPGAELQQDHEAHVVENEQDGASTPQHQLQDDCDWFTSLMARAADVGAIATQGLAVERTTPTARAEVVDVKAREAEVDAKRTSLAAPSDKSKDSRPYRENRLIRPGDRPQPEKLPQPAEPQPPTCNKNCAETSKDGSVQAEAHPDDVHMPKSNHIDAAQPDVNAVHSTCKPMPSAPQEQVHPEQHFCPPLPKPPPAPETDSQRVWRLLEANSRTFTVVPVYSESQKRDMATLGLGEAGSPTAKNPMTEAAIQAAYRARALRCHPDKAAAFGSGGGQQAGPAEDKGRDFVALTKARDSLLSKVKTKGGRAAESSGENGNEGQMKSRQEQSIGQNETELKRWTTNKIQAARPRARTVLDDLFSQSQILSRSGQEEFLCERGAQPASSAGDVEDGLNLLAKNDATTSTCTKVNASRKRPAPPASCLAEMSGTKIARLFGAQETAARTAAEPPSPSLDAAARRALPDAEMREPSPPPYRSCSSVLPAGAHADEAVHGKNDDSSHDADAAYHGPAAVGGRSTAANANTRKNAPLPDEEGQGEAPPLVAQVHNRAQHDLQPVAPADPDIGAVLCPQKPDQREVEPQNTSRNSRQEAGHSRNSIMKSSSSATTTTTKNRDDSPPGPVRVAAAPTSPPPLNLKLPNVSTLGSSSVLLGWGTHEFVGGRDEKRNERPTEKAEQDSKAKKKSAASGAGRKVQMNLASTSSLRVHQSLFATSDFLEPQISFVNCGASASAAAQLGASKQKELPTNKSTAASSVISTSTASSASTSATTTSWSSASAATRRGAAAPAGGFRFEDDLHLVRAEAALGGTERAASSTTGPSPFHAGFGFGGVPIGRPEFDDKRRENLQQVPAPLAFTGAPPLFPPARVGRSVLDARGDRDHKTRVVPGYKKDLFRECVANNWSTGPYIRGEKVLPDKDGWIRNQQN